MTDRKKRLARILCMTSDGGGGGDKPWDEMTWDEVVAATKDGKYKNFEIGAMKELDLGTEGIVHMQIVGIDADELADGSGYAPLTFISKELLNTDHRMNPARTPSAVPYDEGTGSVGGWDKSEMKQYILGTVAPNVPSVIRNNVKTVKKYTKIRNTAGSVANNVETSETFWLASMRELYGEVSQGETQGPIYSEAFSDDSSRAKKKIGATFATNWWGRSAFTSSTFLSIDANGRSNSNNSYNSYAIAIGFCL